MRRPRKHARRGNRIGIRWVPVLLAFAGVLVLLLAGAAYAGYRYDRASASKILPGVKVAGVDVGGMTRDQALRALEPVSRGILDRTISVWAGHRDWTVTPESLGTKVDLAGAVDRAFSLEASYDWPTRIYHRLLHRPIEASVDVSVRYDRNTVWRFVQKVAGQVERPSRDASLGFVDNEVVIVRSRTGATARVQQARRALLQALRTDRDRVTVGIKVLQPAVTEDALPMTIIVRTTLNKLYLYDGTRLVKTYDVATGQPQYPTPHGTFEIVNKRTNPTWVNPALETWGKNEPAVVPPGPDNPLGTRALDLSVSGIRIHGTPDDASIGHAASHGCIRMHIPDSEDLFNRVEVGTTVIIAY